MLNSITRAAVEVANTEFSIFRRVRGTPPFFSKPPLNGKRISSFLDNDHPNRRTGLEIKKRQATQYMVGPNKFFVITASVFCVVLVPHK